MQAANIAAAAQLHINTLMPSLGINKQRELVRLVFEIAKRDNCPASLVLPQKMAGNFDQAKTYLLKKRYPKTYGKVPAGAFYLPKLDLAAQAAATTGQQTFYPKNIFIEEDAVQSQLAKRAMGLFPLANVHIIAPKTHHGAADYTARKDNLVIINERFDFTKRCPCTSGANCCGYNLVNLGFGCYYDCAYCFLQQYQNLHAIVLPANINSFLQKVAESKFSKGPFDKPRIGSGEFTDSLLFDHITNYSTDIINFFRGRGEYFEFKTKSTNIANILKQEPADNIVVAWSVNPQNIIDTAEFLTPSLAARLAAAAKVADHGFKTAFHFDPVILHDNWQQNYADIVAQIAQTIVPQSIMWFSIGTLRFSRELKKCIESRFPQNSIMDEEFALDFDGKMRYETARRNAVYNYLAPLLRKAFPNATTYLCMEQGKI